MCVLSCLVLVGAVAGCGGDEGTEADRIGVGAECTADPSNASPPDEEIELQCLDAVQGRLLWLGGLYRRRRLPRRDQRV